MRKKVRLQYICQEGERVNVMSRCFSGSLWREGSLLAMCVGQSLDSDLVARFGEKAAYRPYVCWWEPSPSLLVARFGEKASYGGS